MEVSNQLDMGLITVTEAVFKAFDLGWHIESINSEMRRFTYNREDADHNTLTILCIDLQQKTFGANTVPTRFEGVTNDQDQS